MIGPAHSRRKSQVMQIQLTAVHGPGILRAACRADRQEGVVLQCVKRVVRNRTVSVPSDAGHCARECRPSSFNCGRLLLNSRDHKQQLGNDMDIALL